MRSAEAHQRTDRRLFDEVWNGRDLSVIAELYCVDFVADYRPYAPLRHGHDGVRAMVAGAIAAFPDYHEELLGMCVGHQRGIVDNLLALRQAGVMPTPPSNDGS